MKIIIPFLICTASLLTAKGQAILNEVYTDPNAGKNEFFELYNTSTSSTPLSVDNYTIVTFFDRPTEKGFYVMDLPDMTVASKGYFVGSSIIPFNYQGINNSTASDFSWNSPSFTANNGYVKKWVQQTINLSDGNLGYDEAPLPVNFNDFFFRRTGFGSSYSIFVYQNGVLVNACIFGTGGYASVIPVIIGMPSLFVDMSGTAADFTIDFSIYGTIPVETVSQDAGSDNGFIRTADGLCGGWTKSSAGVQHTPQQTNGYVDGLLGSISATAIIRRGTVASGSEIEYDVVAAPITSFPVEMQIYKDIGDTMSKLDGNDIFLESNTEYVVTDGPFISKFFPYDINMLLVLKSSAGCIDKVMFLPNISVLPVKLNNFQGYLTNNKVSLQWSVSENENCNQFEVEKSFDGKNFTTTALVFGSDKPGTENYGFSEIMNAEKVFYRLRMTDKSKAVTYSKILVFQSSVSADQTIRIMNNPATDKLTFSFNLKNSGQADVKVIDLMGRIQMKQIVNGSEGANYVSMQLASAMQSGIYIVDVVAGSDRYNAKFVKQ